MSLSAKLSGAGQRLFKACEYIQGISKGSLVVGDESEQMDLLRYLDDLEQVQNKLIATTKQLVASVRNSILEKVREELYTYIE